MTTDTRVRRAEQVAYSVELVAEIAANYDRSVDQEAYLPARCMLDAFYVHIRLLGDFLIKDTKKTDFGPEQFGVMGWAAPQGPERDQLEEAWDVASKYVVHFGHPRVPEELQELATFEVSGTAFRRLAADALVLFKAFVDEVDAVRPPWSGGARIPDPDVEPDAWGARAWSDAADILRTALEHAYVHLGEGR